jgi:hypothetical protein
VNTFAQGSVSGCSFAEAITSANNDADFGNCAGVGAYGADTINLTAGTYNLTAIDNDANGLPVITDPDGLTINGNGSTLARTLGNVAPFFRFIQVDAGPLTINGLTLSGGNVNLANGGAILMNAGGGSLTVTDSPLTGNTAGSAAFSGNGGAIYDGSTRALTVTNSPFSNNTAFGNGGAIYKPGGSGVTVTDSPFTGNTAGDANFSGNGGAIYDGSTRALTVTRSAFSNNTAFGNGGAVYKPGGSSTTVTDSPFTGNTAGFTGFSGNGGALYDGSSGTGPATNNCFVHDTAFGSGGSIFRAGAPTLNAENNWWGAANGPSEEGPGSGDGVSTNVDFIPFLTAAQGFCPQQPIPTLSEWAQRHDRPPDRRWPPGPPAHQARGAHPTCLTTHLPPLSHFHVTRRLLRGQSDSPLQPLARPLS